MPPRRSGRDRSTDSALRGRWIEYVLLAAVVLLVYFPALSNDFVNWDDPLFVTRNQTLQSFRGLRQIWTTLEMPKGFPNYPLAFTSYWFDYRIWGLDPLGYHLTNVILHLCNTLLVLVLVRGLGAADWTARLTAALFAVHPMQVESVAWVTERKNVLSACFFLTAFILYLHHEKTQRWRWYVLSLVFFAAALLSKTATLVLPVSLLLVERLRTGRWSGASLRRLSPLFALGLIAGLLTLGVEPQSFSAPPAARPLLAAASVDFYVLKLVAPWRLLPVYPRWHFAVTALRWWLPLIALLAGVFIVRRWASHWHIRWGLAHFVSMLLPALGIVGFAFTEHSYVADRFVYLAAIGFFFALSTALYQLRCRAGASMNAVAVVLLAALSALTWRQVRVWRDSVTLWTYTLTGNPGSVEAENNLASALIDRRQLDEAARHALAALAISPADPDARANLGVIYSQRGDFESAIRQYGLAIAVKPDDDTLRRNLGMALEAKGQLAAAEREYQRAFELSPEPAYSYLLGKVLIAEGRLQDAIAAFEGTVRVRPDMAEAQNELGRALLEAGRAPEATRAFATVVRLEPESAEARYNLGLALYRSGRSREAVPELEAALHLSPDLAEAAQLLAQIRGREGAHPIGP